MKGDSRDLAQRARPRWNECVLMRENVREQSQDRNHRSYTLLPTLHEQNYQTQYGNYGQKAKFQVLTPVEEIVKMPKILGPWGHREQDSCEQHEYSTPHRTRRRTLVHPRSPRGVSLFQ